VRRDKRGVREKGVREREQEREGERARAGGKKKLGRCGRETEGGRARPYERERPPAHFVWMPFSGWLALVAHLVALPEQCAWEEVWAVAPWLRSLLAPARPLVMPIVSSGTPRKLLAAAARLSPKAAALYLAALWKRSWRPAKLLVQPPAQLAHHLPLAHVLRHVGGAIIGAALRVSSLAHSTTPLALAQNLATILAVTLLSNIGSGALHTHLAAKSLRKSTTPPMVEWPEEGKAPVLPEEGKVVRPPAQSTAPASGMELSSPAPMTTNLSVILLVFSSVLLVLGLLAWLTKRSALGMSRLRSPPDSKVKTHVSVDGSNRSVKAVAKLEAATAEEVARIRAEEVAAIEAVRNPAKEAKAAESARIAVAEAEKARVESAAQTSAPEAAHIVAETEATETARVAVVEAVAARGGAAETEAEIALVAAEESVAAEAARLAAERAAAAEATRLAAAAEEALVAAVEDATVRFAAETEVPEAARIASVEAEAACTVAEEAAATEVGCLTINGTVAAEAESLASEETATTEAERLTAKLAAATEARIARFEAKVALNSAERTADAETACVVFEKATDMEAASIITEKPETAHVAVEQTAADAAPIVAKAQTVHIVEEKAAAAEAAYITIDVAEAAQAAPIMDEGPEAARLAPEEAAAAEDAHVTATKAKAACITPEEAAALESTCITTEEATAAEIARIAVKEAEAARVTTEEAAVAAAAQLANDEAEAAKGARCRADSIGVALVTKELPDDAAARGCDGRIPHALVAVEPLEDSEISATALPDKAPVGECTISHVLVAVEVLEEPRAEDDIPHALVVVESLVDPQLDAVGDDLTLAMQPELESGVEAKGRASSSPSKMDHSEHRADGARILQPVDALPSEGLHVGAWRSGNLFRPHLVRRGVRSEEGKVSDADLRHEESADTSFSFKGITAPDSVFGRRRIGGDQEKNFSIKCSDSLQSKPARTTTQQSADVTFFMGRSQASKPSPASVLDSVEPEAEPSMDNFQRIADSMFEIAKTEREMDETFMLQRSRLVHASGGTIREVWSPSNTPHQPGSQNVHEAHATVPQQLRSAEAARASAAGLTIERSSNTKGGKTRRRLQPAFELEGML